MRYRYNVQTNGIEFSVEIVNAPSQDIADTTLRMYFPLGSFLYRNIEKTPLPNVMIWA